MGFARDVTPDEVELGFARVEHLGLGVVVTAKLGIGIRAVKLREQGVVSYAICDDSFFVLYAPARSIAELRARFGFAEQKAG